MSQDTETAYVISNRIRQYLSFLIGLPSYPIIRDYLYSLKDEGLISSYKIDYENNAIYVVSSKPIEFIVNCEIK